MEAVISVLIGIAVSTGDITPLIAFMLTCKWAYSCSLHELRPITAHNIAGIERDFLRDLAAVGTIDCDIACQFLLIKHLREFSNSDGFVECVVRNFSMELIDVIRRYIGIYNYDECRAGCSFIAILSNNENAFKCMVDNGFFIENERWDSDLSSLVGFIIKHSRINMLKYLCMSDNYDIFASMKVCNIELLRRDMVRATPESMQILWSRCSNIRPDDSCDDINEVREFFMRFNVFRKMIRA